MMSDDDNPSGGRESEIPPPRSSQRPSRPPGERLPFERIVPDILKRGLEASRGMGDSFFFRELASNVVSQLGDAREGVVKAVAQEVGRFLRQADIASELRNVLAGLEMEATVHVKFQRAKDADEAEPAKATRVSIRARERTRERTSDEPK